MTARKEDREDYGEYRYNVFRISRDGKKEQIAESVYEWGYNSYSEDDCGDWENGFEEYLKNSVLLLST